MALRSGISIGPFEILDKLGAGGMGEVWRARDSRLGRDVAIKALPTEFALDSDRLARFEREAKVLASLNHGNIAAIYGLEQPDSQQFLVLELVEGETLAQRIARGALPVDEALRLAIQIADAIEAAHEKDIIHRDLKPANIKVTPDGKVKVLDFGLAKAFEGAGSGPNVSNSPTLSLAATAQGVILGTAAYMSPEQARGQIVDRRTDIWAFGCVVYEMLAGRHAFRGDHVSDILASVLAREPEYSDLPASLSPRLRDALRRCFEKNPKRRWQAIGDLRVELEQVLADPTAGLATAPARANGRLIALAAAVAALVAAPAGWFLRPQPAPSARPIARFEHVIPAVQTQFRNTGRNILAVSPDGRHFAYNGIAGTYLRSLDTPAARLVPGTELMGSNPVFSPDGEWIASWSASVDAIQKIAITGGASVTIAASAQPLSIWWGPDGNLLVADLEGIKRVSANGGPLTLLIDGKNQSTFGSPTLLPDGKTILYSRIDSSGADRWDQGEIVAQQPGGAPKVVLRGGSDAMYVPTGHLVYANGNVLYAVPFDLTTLAATGSPVPVVPGVQRTTGAVAPSANYGITTQGTLIYLAQYANAAGQDTTLSVADRAGLVRPLAMPKAAYRNPRVSPDGRQIAVETVAADGQGSIWIYDLKGSAAIRRLTQDGDSTRPVWSPDGKRIAYAANHAKPQGIFWQLADGSGLPERLTATSDPLHQDYPESFSRDGKVLSFARVKPPLGQNAWSLWTLRLDGERTPALFFDLPDSNEFGSAFSPDGKWIAYASNAAPNGGAPTAFAIYLQPYPPTGVKYQISQTGGAWPIWASSGHELIYRLSGTAAGGQRFQTVAVTTDPVPTFTAEQTLPIRGFVSTVNNREYDVFPDGRQFVMVTPAVRQDAGPAPAIHVDTILNWTEELKARVPTDRRW
jgi:dipeptidyl aminopeptidase/acylaminoacyl peptidase